MPRMPVQSIAFWLLDQARGNSGAISIASAVAQLTLPGPSQTDLDDAATILESAGNCTVVRASGHAVTVVCTTQGLGNRGIAIAAIRSVPG